MSKTVLTYSWLMKKAMAMFKKDPNDYRELMDGGTTKMLRGLRVVMDGAWCTAPSFTLYHPVEAKRYATLHCQHIGGKFYTSYVIHFSTTEYRKRITDKYLPITLPEGVRSRSNKAGSETPCIIHNADGSVACTTVFRGGRVRRPGECAKRLVICDDTGKYAGDDEALGGILLGYTNCNARTVFGWFPGASRNRTEWLDSIKAIPDGMCDHQKMLTVAAKAYLAVAKMVQKYPHLRMAMFPAAPASNESWQEHRVSTDVTRRTVMARSPDGEPTLYNLPEVVLYWVEADCHWQSHPKAATPRLSITIPPHGNPLLDPTGKAATGSRTARDKAQARRRFDEMPLPLGYEQAYHSLICWKPGVNESGTPGKSHRVIKFDERGDWSEQEENLTVWTKHENKVLMEFQCDELTEDEVGNCPFPMDTPVAIKPEDIALRFEEKFLMESLPLC